MSHNDDNHVEHWCAQTICTIVVLSCVHQLLVLGLLSCFHKLLVLSVCFHKLFVLSACGEECNICFCLNHCSISVSV